MAYAVTTDLSVDCESDSGALFVFAAWCASHQSHVTEKSLYLSGKILHGDFPCIDVAFAITTIISSIPTILHIPGTKKLLPPPIEYFEMAIHKADSYRPEYIIFSISVWREYIRHKKPK